VAIPCASRNSVGMGQRCQWTRILDRGMENVPGERYRNTKETKVGAFVEEEEVLSWGVTFHVELYCKKVDCSAPKLHIGLIRRYMAQMGGRTDPTQSSPRFRFPRIGVVGNGCTAFAGRDSTRFTLLIFRTMVPTSCFDASVSSTAG
jgi:hypothetical protein